MRIVEALNLKPKKLLRGGKEYCPFKVAAIVELNSPGTPEELMPLVDKLTLDYLEFGLYARDWYVEVNNRDDILK